MKYIIFLSLLILSFASHAGPTCSIKGTQVIYTNGVATAQGAAQAALEKLESFNLNSSIEIHEENVFYDLAYNYNENLAADLLEATVQRFPTGFLNASGVSNGYAAYRAYQNGGLANAIYAAALNSIVDKIVEIQGNWIINYRNSSFYLKNVNEIKTKYESALNKGFRVFAISHSQGGLFMNDAYTEIEFTNKHKFFSGFQIASPSNSVPMSKFGYATHNKDRLINFVRTTVGTFPSNINAPLIVNNAYEGFKDYVLDVVLNHGMVSTYLNDSTIKSQVISKLIETAQFLDSNCPKAIINYTINNQQIALNSTDPEDPKVTGLIYSWSFGDNQFLDTTSKIVTHDYLAPGPYSVKLVVKDDKETIFSSTEIRIVINSLVKNSLVYYFANRDVMFGLEGPLATSGLNLTYVWDFGDGAQAETSSVVIIHKYNNEGSYPVTLNVYDSNNNLLFIKTTVIVVDRVRATMCADTIDILRKDIVSTTILGFNGQIDLDPNILGRCYIKSNGYFNNNNGQVCAYLFNCTKFSLIP